MLQNWCFWFCWFDILCSLLQYEKPPNTVLLTDGKLSFVPLIKLSSQTHCDANLFLYADEKARFQSKQNVKDKIFKLNSLI